uniref:VOC domain-containing protein n=1 Tax=Eucampia antarctica TaxID=49252 RepID=A0A7S2RXJ3_9STRA|mmetsp:Transcript_28172/g.26994  ORF Transcript_28172/g.26994 Transcript_28172/m.26994 type:complete len:133 (+) Transcript_28172:59-457(+)
MVFSATAVLREGVRLGRTVLMVRGGACFETSVQFYRQGLGWKLVRATEGEYAEFEVDSGHKFMLTVAKNEAQLSTGYSPLLSFDVYDMDSTVAKCAQLGAHLDGPIQYPAHGKVAALRTPDGHMIGLYEPAI